MKEHRKHATSRRKRVHCSACGAEQFVDLGGLRTDSVLCSCGEKIDVSLERAVSVGQHPGGGDEYPRYMGTYKLLKRLGKGGQATVHLGIDSLGRQVAVKQYRTGGLIWDEARREAELAMRCACLNVVNTYRVLEEELAIVSEYVAGDTLDRTIEMAVASRAGRSTPVLTPDLVMDILTQLLRGLLVCHLRGVLHLDIKPGNVVLDSSAGLVVAKLMDFGVARNLMESRSVSVTGSIRLATSEGEQYRGTPLYAAPEQIDIRRKHLVSARTDLYQLGVVAYEMLSGHRPVEAPSIPDVLAGILAGGHVPLQDRVHGLSDELLAWVTSLLSFEPDRRPRSAKAALDTLERLRLEEAARSLPRPRARTRWPLLLALVLGAGLGGTAVVVGRAAQGAWERQVQRSELAEAMQAELNAVDRLRVEGGSRAELLARLHRLEGQLTVLRQLQVRQAVADSLDRELRTLLNVVGEMPEDR